VFALKSFEESNPVSASPQSVAVLNIFDAGPAIALIKTSRFHENLAADCSTGSPKGRRFLIGILVNIVVEKILVL